MTIDMTKINALILQLVTTALALGKLAVLVVLVMVGIDVIAGTNLGAAARATSLLNMSAKEILLWGVGALVVYKAILKP